MDPHSSTAMCRKANVWYILHNMYLVNQSTTFNYYAAENINSIAEITS
jgi:hypothetical protein